jgi:hypothetical protein
MIHRVEAPAARKRGATERTLIVGFLGWCAALVALRLAELAGVAFAAGGRAELALAGGGVLVATVATRGSRRRASLTVAFVLWRSIHYAVWLQVVPIEQAGARSFRQSWRALRADFGPTALLALTAAMLALVGFAARSLTRTRDRLRRTLGARRQGYGTHSLFR